MPTNEAATQAALRKIKACLALAASSNPTEAETALRQAQALMQKHRLDMGDVNADRANAHKSKATVKKQPADWEITLVSTVEKAMSCKAIFTHDWFGGKAQWTFIGIGINPELAGYAFEVLLKQLKADREHHKKTALARVRKLANKRNRLMAFCEAWANAIYYKVQRLAISKPDAEAIAAYIEKNHRINGNINGRAAQQNNATDNDRHSGHTKGSQAQLNRPVSTKVDPTKKLEAL